MHEQRTTSIINTFIGNFFDAMMFPPNTRKNSVKIYYYYCFFLIV